MTRIYNLVQDDANLERTSWQLEHGESADATHPSGTPLLNLASREGAVATVALLLEKKASQKARGPVGHTALHDAISGPGNEVARHDAEHIQRRVKVVKRLLAQPGAYPAGDEEAARDLAKALSLLCSDWTLLTSAAGMEMAVELRKAGARPDVAPGDGEPSAQECLERTIAANRLDTGNEPHNAARAMRRLLASENKAEWEAISTEVPKPKTPGNHGGTQMGLRLR